MVDYPANFAPFLFCVLCVKYFLEERNNGDLISITFLVNVISRQMKILLLYLHYKS